MTAPTTTRPVAIWHGANRSIVLEHVRHCYWAHYYSDDEPPENPNFKLRYLIVFVGDSSWSKISLDAEDGTDTRLSTAHDFMLALSQYRETRTFTGE